MTDAVQSSDEVVPEGFSRLGRISTVIIFLAILFCPAPAELPLNAWRLVAVTMAMAVLWFTQGIPIPATGLIPLVAYPLLGIQKADDVSKSYIDSNIWLSLGGFIIALGIERWGLHRRLALQVLRVLGTSPRRLVLGFMVATGFISMWISNTAATLMMLPIGLALIRTLEEVASSSSTNLPSTEAGKKNVSLLGSGDSRPTLGTADLLLKPDMSWLPLLAPVLLMGIAYAASIGGIVTPIGTPTNVAFLGIWKKQFPQAPEIPSGQWIFAFLPCGVLMLLSTWLVLSWKLPFQTQQTWLTRDFFRRRLEKLGWPGRGEIWMFTIFLTTSLLWIFRTDFRLGEQTLIIGWGRLLEILLTTMGWEGSFRASHLHDATVSIGMCLLMFWIPIEKDVQNKTVFLMDWKTAEKLPWGLILLFGGGFAMAGAFESTGLATWIGKHLSAFLPAHSPWLWVTVVTLALVFLTEFTSNVATVNMFLPLLAGLSLSLGCDPRLLMLPATIATSLGFMMPAGTPPNAIAFGTGRVRMDQMVKYGFILNLVGCVIVIITTMFWVVPVMGISLNKQLEGMKSTAGGK